MIFFVDDVAVCMIFVAPVGTTPFVLHIADLHRAAPGTGGSAAPPVSAAAPGTSDAPGGIAAIAGAAGVTAPDADELVDVPLSFVAFAVKV